jgi:cell division protein FtsN
MSDKPPEKPACTPINFNLQGSISFGEKKEPPKDGDKPKKQPPIEIIINLTFKVVVPISFALYVIFSASSTPKPQQPSPPDVGLKVGEYTILIGSFADSKQAEGLATKLREGRINNFIVKSQGKWHVCVGKYWSMDRANRVKEELVERGYDDAAVLSPQKK